MTSTDVLKKELEEIRNELAALEKSSRAYKALLADKAEIEAQLIGSGAIAQGGNATAIGERGILIEGNFGGNVYIGHEPKSETEALSVYCREIIASSYALPLRGIDLGIADGVSTISMANVYIDLNTTTLVEEDNES